MPSFFVKIIFVVFFYALVHCAYTLDYRDLERMGIACPDRDKCQGYRNNLHYLNRSCECDSACTTYNDCCIDVSRRSSGRPKSPSNIICLNYGENRLSGIYVLSKCSSNWNGPQEIRQRCEGSTDFSDPMNAVPVTSESEAVTYKNLYCAECNNAQIESLKLFEFKVACKSVENMSEKEIMDKLSYNQRLNSWGVDRTDAQGKSNFAKCTIFFELPSYLNNNVRFCRANIVSTCPQDWTRQQVKKACEEYMAVVFDSTRAYRNPHCAICNDKSASELTCTSKTFGRRETFTSKILVDINPKPGTSSKCPTNQIYDTFFKKCKKLKCAFPGYVLRNAKCVPGS